jgi:glucarate dehydratase
VPPWQIVQNPDDARVVKAFGAIEIALWDLRGKAWGQPLATLIGGQVREKVAFSEYFGFREGREMTPEAVVDYCLKMRDEHSSTIFEGKLNRAALKVWNRQFVEHGALDHFHDPAFPVKHRRVPLR